jgi:hypothetical protein
MAFGSEGGLTPFDPGVSSGGSTGYSTNLINDTAKTTPAPTEPVVFVGYRRSPDDIRAGLDPNSPDSLKAPGVPTWATLSQLLSEFDSFDRDRFLKFRNMFIAAGIVPQGADPLTVRTAFAGILGEVADMSTSGTNISPMGYVKNLIRMNGLDPSEVDASENYGTEEGFTGTKTQTTRNITEITEGQAWSGIQGALSSMLGRDPSDQETRDFTYRMNQMAAENPSISKTVYRFRNGDQVGTTTHTDPGFTPDDMQQDAYDTAQNDPEYAEYRGASTYFNAAMSALGPIGG